jgi:hypothetical protein
LVQQAGDISKAIGEVTGNSHHGRVSCPPRRAPCLFPAGQLSDRVDDDRLVPDA